MIGWCGGGGGVWWWCVCVCGCAISCGTVLVLVVVRREVLASCPFDVGAGAKQGELVAVLRDEDGNDVTPLSLVTDVAASAAAQEALEESETPRAAEEETETVDGELVDQLPEGVAIEKVLEAQKEAAEAKERADKLAAQLAVMTKAAEDAAADLLRMQDDYEQRIKDLTDETAT